MAALITQVTGAAVAVVEGARGEFSVLVDGETVARKDARGFPSDDDAVAAVTRALAQ